MSAGRQLLAVLFKMKKRLVIKDYSGGIGTASEKRDVSNSARFTKNLNPFEDPSYITLSRKTTKVSGSTVTDLVRWSEDGSPWSTSRYFYAEDGKIHQETSGGTWSTLRTVSGSNGEGFLIFDDYLYYALTAELGRYGKLSGTPAFNDSFLTDGTTNVDQSGGATTATDYVPPTSISEAATARQTFTPSKDPLKAIIINVDVVGSGDWTVTVHDSNNVLIGSATIVNASMSTGDVPFTPSTPLRVVIGNEYHFHVTSTVADGGVDTGTDTDLEDAEFSTLFGILVSNDFHPMVKHLNFIAIGNERYIATWDQALYEPNKIVLPAGYQVRSIAGFDEFIAIGAFKGTSLADAEEARIYFWDGFSSTFNYYKPCTMGAVNALHNSKGRLFGVYGNKGSMYLGSDPFEDIVNEVPKLTRGKVVGVYPGAITEHEGRTLIGVGASTDDSAGLVQGAYEWGRQQVQLPEGLNRPFTISTGTTQATTVKIGMVKSFGKDLYIGWRDNSAYGVDKIAEGDGANASGEFESLIFDGGDPDTEKLALNLIVKFEGLTTGQSVTPKYKLDRASSFTAGTAISTSGAVRAEEAIYKRFKEIEVGFTLASTSNTFLKITEIVLEYDDCKEERQE